MSEWHCSINNTRYGPISKDQLLSWLAEGRVSSSDLVWREGMAEWQPAGSVAELGAPSPLGAAAPPMPPRRPSLRPHRGGTVLVLGILGLVVCFICGIIAWVMGNEDLRQMKAGRMDPSGRSNTQAGRICGMISTILAIAALVFYLVIFALAAAL